MNRYLLIDDDDIIQFIHRKVISAVDPEADVSAVFSADKGLEALLNWDSELLPDFIFIDISMPVKTGFDLLDVLMSEHPALHDGLMSKSRVFLLTSSVNPRDLDRAKAFPLIERMLSKPLTPELMKQLQAVSPKAPLRHEGTA